MVLHRSFYLCLSFKLELVGLSDITVCITIVFSLNIPVCPVLDRVVIVCALISLVFC